MKLIGQFWLLRSFLLILFSYWSFLAGSAGVLPYSLYQGKYVILLGVDHHRPGYWIDFGGKGDHHETTLETAAREFSEETMFSFFSGISVVQNKLQSIAPIVAPNRYHMYPLAVPFIPDLNKIHQALHAKYHKPGHPGSGARWLNAHHVEKIDYAWVWADDLKNAYVAARGNPEQVTLKSIDGRPIRLHSLLARTLGTTTGQNFLFGI